MPTRDAEQTADAVDLAAAATTAAPHLRELFTTSFSHLVGLARLLGSDDPEDTAAEAFAQLHRTWGKLRDPRAGVAYARTTVVRLTSNRRRHLAVVDAHARRQQVAAAQSAEHEVLARADDGLMAAMQSLTEARRTAIVLRYYADLPFDDVAAAMGCSAATARSHVRRGLADLRSLWTTEGDRQ